MLLFDLFVTKLKKSSSEVGSFAFNQSENRDLKKKWLIEKINFNFNNLLLLVLLVHIFLILKISKVKIKTILLTKKILRLKKN